jgi:prophage regulatory protein
LDAPYRIQNNPAMSNTFKVLHMVHLKFLPLPETLAARGRPDGRSSHYSDIAAGLWTRPVKTGARSIAWPEHEIDALNAARLAGKSDEEIRAVVAALHAARLQVA